MATIDAKKLLPPSKKTENSEKFLVPVTSIVPKRSVTLSANALRPIDKPADAGTSVSPSDNLVGKIVKVENILKSNLALQIKEGINKDREEKNKETEEKEKKLEIKQDKKSKVPLPSLPRIGFLDALRNYFINTLLGFVAVKLFDMAPKLIKFLDATKPIITFIGFLGKNLFDGFVGFIENGYKAYDEVRKFTKTVGGENAQKLFDEFSKNLNLVLNGAIVAAGLAISTAPRTPAGRTGAGTGAASGAVKGASQILERGVLSRANASFSRYITGNANIGDRARLLRRGYIDGRQALSKGGEKALQQGAARKSAQEVAKQAATQGAKQSAKFAITKAPIIGALIGFIIDTVIFKEKPTRAAAGAVGNAIGSAVGAGLLGGGTFGLGAGVGLFVGGWVGDWIGKSLYDTIASFNQQPVQGRAQGGQISTGGRTGTPTRSIKKTRRPVKRITPQKTQPGKDAGGLRKIEELYGTDEPGTRSALRALKKSSQEVKRVKSINGLSGAMFGAGIDMALGQKPDKNLARSLGDMFGSVVQNAIDVEMNSAFSDITKTLAMANGGVVPQRGLRDNMNIGERIGRYVSNAFSVAIENSSSKVFENLRRELNLEGGPPGGGPGGPGGGGGEIPGDAPPEVKAMLEAISAGEGGWDSVNPGTTVPGLSNMTIADARKAAIAKGVNQLGGSGAMGKWQQMPAFILERARDAGLDPNKDKFTPENQTKIARMLMASVYPGGESQLVKDAQRDPMSAAAKLRGTWPSLPGGSQANTTEKKFRENFAESLQSYKSPSAVLTKGSFASVLPRGNPQFISGFGSRWGRNHQGIDIGVDANSPVTALQDGKVVAIYENFGGHGVGIVVQHSDGTKIVYGHVNANVREGDTVKKGQTIATVKGWFNAYGNKDNTHLHLERYVGGSATDPTGYLNSLSKPQPGQLGLGKVLSSTKVNGATYTAREGGQYFKNGSPITQDEYDKAFGLQLSSVPSQQSSSIALENLSKDVDTEVAYFKEYHYFYV